MKAINGKTKKKKEGKKWISSIKQKSFPSKGPSQSDFEAQWGGKVAYWLYEACMDLQPIVTIDRHLSC